MPRLIEYISSAMVLYPGDVTATGTRARVGQVTDGQEVAIEITNLGRLTVSVSSAGAVACPTLGKDRGPKPPAEVTRPGSASPDPPGAETGSGRRGAVDRRCRLDLGAAVFLPGIRFPLDRLVDRPLQSDGVPGAVTVGVFFRQPPDIWSGIKGDDEIERTVVFARGSMQETIRLLRLQVPWIWPGRPPSRAFTYGYSPAARTRDGSGA